MSTSKYEYGKTEVQLAWAGILTVFMYSIVIINLNSVMFFLTIYPPPFPIIFFLLMEETYLSRVHYTYLPYCSKSKTETK